MASVYILPCVTLLVGLVLGSAPHTFLVAALAAACASWRKPWCAYKLATLFVNMDPCRPEADILCAAFKQARDMIRCTQLPLSMRIAATALTAKAIFKIDLNREGDLEVQRAGMRPMALHQAGVWLPDLPLPLALPVQRSTTLYLEPSGAQRIRIAELAREHCSRRTWLLLVLLVVLGCCTNTHIVVAMALAFALQTYLMERCHV